ncbi:MAG: VWA domain-containing protein [Phycisphaeraceae bacterium]
MGFISPISALIAAAIAVPALVALYFLKLRRREVVIPSTLLWRKAVQDMQVNAPFQKLRRNLLLLLQLVILGALLVAMARPALDAAAAPGQRVVILIDHSASMNATDGEPTRLDEARRRTRELVDSLDGGAAMIVSFAEQARVVEQFTSDAGRLRAALERVEATDQRGRLIPALQLVEPYAAEAAASDEVELMVYVVTDGRVHRPAEAPPLSLQGAQVRYLAVGSRDASAVDNVGIVAFAARRAFDAPEQVRVLARVANYGPSAVATDLRLRVDGRTRRVETVRLGPAGDAASTEMVPFSFASLDAAIVELTQERGDQLAADDAARLMLAPARQLRVLLVTEGNTFLERVIDSVGVRERVTMPPDVFEQQSAHALRRGGWGTDDADEGETGFDAIVFDGYSPEAVPLVDSLYFGAAPPIERLALRAGREDDPAAQAVLDWQRAHPVLRHVALDHVVLRRPGRLAVPTDGRVLATAQTGPVLAEVQRAGVRHVVASFDVMESNWPLYVSFPVFMSNVTHVLGLGALADEAALAYRSGEAVALPVTVDADRLRYEGPATLTARAGGEGGGGGGAVLPAFPRVGLYEARGVAVQPPYDRLAVNLLDATESDIRPVHELALVSGGGGGGGGGSGQASAARDEDGVRREVWPWFAAAALVVLMIEWVVYTRRMHL